MSKEIRFSFLHRDMWQSSCKYVPRKDQLERIAPVIADMGCFSRVETNGGGFEQIQLLFGENPNKAVRAWCKPLNDAGIQTHMLDRGLNGIRLNPVPKDIRQLMFKVKGKQGVNIARSFDGLNDARNIIDSMKYAKEAGMIAQGALCITHSEIHTVDYYVNLAEELIAGGADELCLKDMAGIGRPASLGKIVKAIKTGHPDTVIEYHGHSGPGFSVASILEMVRAGVEIVDCSIEPLSWGTGHADILTVTAMLQDAGYKTPPVNMKAYMEARRLTQSFIDDFLGYYMDPRNRQMSSLLIRSGLPGGMMGSLMADLKTNLESINKYLTDHNQPAMTEDEIMIQLFDEVEYIWPKLGYPPLVTPYSQYVKNIAMMNIRQLIRGKERFSMIDDNTWDMLLGKQGKLPGPVAPEIVELAARQGREFYTGHPQDLYPDELDTYRKEMDDNGWDYGQDDEELMELAMHPPQYRNYKSGKAKNEFEEDLANKKKEAETSTSVTIPAASVDFTPKMLNVTVNGEPYEVFVSYGDVSSQKNIPIPAEKKVEPSAVATVPEGVKIIFSPLEGIFYRTKAAGDTPLKVGDTVKVGQPVGYIESMKVYNAVSTDVSGKIVEFCVKDGDPVKEDDALVKIQEQ
ncbi:MAG: oxaloacetate decarboxylase [Deltaproteobacteria bacterium]|nr:oxaloacetate decarboxylase [Deltaproteobacteria bacterium]